MTDHDDHDLERVRFDVLPDGSVEGDDVSESHLAETLRYVCRMGSQIGALVGLGDLERLSTLSSLAVMARVAGASPHVSIRVEVTEMPQPELPAPSTVDASGQTVREAVDRALRRVMIDFASDWAAIITDDKRLVGAMQDQSTGREPAGSVHEVGLRVLAIIGALGEALRETAVRLDFVRGSLLVVAIGDHALYTQADKFDPGEVVRTVSAVQALLVDEDLGRAPGVDAAGPA